jgi:hypothetical protein
MGRRTRISLVEQGEISAEGHAAAPRLYLGGTQPAQLLGQHLLNAATTGGEITLDAQSPLLFAVGQVFQPGGPISFYSWDFSALFLLK